MYKKFLFMAFSLLLLVACKETGTPVDSVPVGGEDSVEYYNVKYVVDIHYDGTSVSVTNPASKGIDVVVTDGAVVVTSTLEGVEYRLSGTSDEGMFKLYSLYKSQLILNGVSLHYSTGPAINIQSKKRLFVVLSDGTENSLSDGVNYVLSDTEDTKGTFFSEGQLIFSGAGSLEIASYYKHGIACDEYILMRSGEITVTQSVGDGIHVKEYYVAEGGTVTLNVSDDGLAVTEGYIELNGGSLTINSVDKGVVTSFDTLTNTTGEVYDLDIRISGGALVINTTGERAHGIESVANVDISGGTVNIVGTGLKTDGIQAVGVITITGGVIEISVTDDCTNGVVEQTGGTLDCL